MAEILLYVFYSVYGAFLLNREEGFLMIEGQLSRYWLIWYTVGA